MSSQPTRERVEDLGQRFAQALNQDDPLISGLGPLLPHQLYVWCVPDAFAVSALLHQQLRVVSPCHATGRDVTVDLEPDQVRAVNPPGVVVAFVTDPGVSDVRGSTYAHQNLFVDAEAAAPWLAQHTHAVTVSVADVYRVLTPFVAEMTAHAKPVGKGVPRRRRDNSDSNRPPPAAN